MLTFCTGNDHKFREVQTELGIRLEQFRDGYPEVQVDTLEEVVISGMDHLDSIIKGPYFIDDTGISIHALNDFPGVYSAYIFKTLGNKHILKLMEGISDRSATFKCVIGYRDEKGDRYIMSGQTDGTITKMINGEQGFGYDPIFLPNGSSSTFAEMGDSEKNQISHRGKAVRKLKNCDAFISQL